jgi:alkanesulfonate monooxygenase SsuD/methylene tetrahydromethanopterin reductase-like flavin-dependent oxidoreductase (luciferase family)
VRLHLGITPWHLNPPTAASIGDQAAFAEANGYESFWLPENHFGEGALPDPLMLLASAATSTSKIQLATTSYLLTLRNPLQAAEQVAVLDQLSGGRVLLGVGRGYAPEMLRAFHVPVAEKRRIFAWTLGLMQQAWSGKAISLDGDPEHAVMVHPRPLQQPHPPIWVAAFGPKALAQAGRMGLPYLSSPMESLQTLADNYAQHRQASVTEGVKPAEIVPLMRTVYVSHDATEVAQLRQRLEKEMENSRLQPGETLDDWTLIGDPAFVRDGIQRYQEALGMTHMVVTRLRLSGLPDAQLRNSVALLAESVLGT